MGTGRLAIGSRKKAAQLVGHAIARRRLHARDEGQWNYGPHDGGSSSDIGPDATRGLALFQIPNGGLVRGFLLPPTEADTARSAGCRTAREAAAAVGLAGAAVEPDYITHATLRYLLRDTRPGQQGAHGFGLSGRSARLEPGEHLVHEIVVVVNRYAVTAARQSMTDAVHEIFLGAGALDLRLGQHHHPVALGHRRGELARLLDTGLHATADGHHQKACVRDANGFHEELPVWAAGCRGRGQYATLQHLHFVTVDNTPWFPFTRENPGSTVRECAPEAEKDGSAGR